MTAPHTFQADQLSMVHCAILTSLQENRDADIFWMKDGDDNAASIAVLDELVAMGHVSKEYHEFAMETGHIYRLVEGHDLRSLLDIDTAARLKQAFS